MTPREKAQPSIDTLLQYMGSKSTSTKKEWAKDIEFVNSVQWGQSESDAMHANNMAALAINEIKVSRDRVVGQIVKNAPGWLATAVENSDTKMAANVSDLISDIWYKSKGNMHGRMAAEDFEDTGFYMLMAYVDYNGDMGKGDIKICRINGQNVFLDPRCSYRNASDSDNIFIVDVYSKSKIMGFYPDFDFKDAEKWKGDVKTYGTGAINEGQVFNPGFIGEEDYYRVIDHYQKIKVDRIRIYDPKTVFEKILDEEAYQRFAAQPAVILTKLGQEMVITDPDEVKKNMEIVRQYGRVIHYMTDKSIMSGTEHPNNIAYTQDGREIRSIPNTTLMINVVRMYDLMQEGKLKTETIKVDRIKLNKIVGEILYKEMVMPITRYPFGITMLHHTGNPYCYGDARLARPIQEEINKIHSLILAYNTNITNVKVFVDESVDKDELRKNWGKAGAQFFSMDMENGKTPFIVQLQAMQNALYDQLERLRMHIQRLYGAYDFQDGLMSSPPQTRGGTLAIYEAGMNRTESKLQLIEEALNDLGTAVAEMIPYVYDRRKVLRITAPNNKPKEFIFNDVVEENGETKIINDLTANKYDIRVISGSTLPNNRWARHEAYLRMFELGVIRDPEPIIRTTDFPDIDDIIERESKLKEVEGIAKEMDQAIKDLQGQLQTKSREVINANEKVEIERFKTRLQSISSKLEQSQLLTQYRLNDMVKNQKQISQSKGAMPKATS
jgi:hypothetical protein